MDHDDYAVQRIFDIHHAKEECSKSHRCIGLQNKQDGTFALCLDSFYASTGLNKYRTSINHVDIKLEGFGKNKKAIILSY